MFVCVASTHARTGGLSETVPVVWWVVNVILSTVPVLVWVVGPNVVKVVGIVEGTAVTVSSNIT